MTYLVIILIVIIIYLYFENKKKDSNLNGELRETQSDGSVRVGLYKNGVQYGECCLYNRYGKIRSRINFENGKLNGSYINYGADENIILKGQYSNDQKIGIWEEFYENGQLKSKYEISESNSPKIIIQYYENGKLKFENGKGYYENDKIKSERQNDAYIEYFENGNIKFRKENNNSRRVPDNISLFQEYYENSNLKEEKIYEDTNQCKYKYLQTLYYENGNIQSKGVITDSGHRKDNEGYWKYYYPNGNLKKEGEFIGGSSSGTWKTYFENGNTESIGIYKSSWKKTGVWKYFDNEGNLINTENNS